MKVIAAVGDSMRFRLHATPIELPRYRPEIDGLRAIAILPVLFFHAHIRGFSGGYVGVDVFFVISGYLITTIVTRGVADGNFSFAHFYERRVRRIFPPLFLVLACCTVAALFLLPPGLLTNYGKSLAAVVLFLANFLFYHRAPGAGYFETGSVVGPLLHAWSLSVEEQFYLLLPLGLVLIHRWVPHYLKFALIVTAACSFGLALWLDPVAAFYLLPARGWELLTGALLAVGTFPALRGRVQREIAALIGIAAIAGAVMLFDKKTGYSFPYALAPCLGTALIIHASEAGPSSVKRALSIRPLIFIGAISYSLYLWHWPVFFFASYYWMQTGSWQLRAGLLLVTLIMAVISYHWIEMPFRGSAGIGTQRRILRWGAVAIAIALAVGIALDALHGIPQRFDAETRTLIAANEAVLAQHGVGSPCWHWHDEIQDASEAARCPIGVEQPRKILFWGDSHLAMLQDAFGRLYDQGAMGGRGALFAVSLGCTPTEGIEILGPNTNCGSLAHFTLLRAEQSDVDTVFLIFSPWWTTTPAPFCVTADGACQRNVTSPAEIQDRVLAEMGRNISALRSLGKTVVVCLPFPVYDRSIPELEIHNAMFAHHGTTLQPREKNLDSYHGRLRDMVLGQGALVFDPRDDLCPGKECLYQSAGVSLYRDDSHLSESATRMLDRSLAAALRTALAGVK